MQNKIIVFLKSYIKKFYFFKKVIHLKEISDCLQDLSTQPIYRILHCSSDDHLYFAVAKTESPWNIAIKWIAKYQQKDWVCFRLVF